MRILYVAPHLPISPTSGGVQRTALLLSALQELGIVDAVFLPAQHPDQAALAAVQSIDARRWVESTDRIAQSWLQRLNLPSWLLLNNGIGAFLTGGRHRWQPYQPLVDEAGDLGGYDLVVARYLSAACILDLFRHPRLVIDVDDYDPDRQRQRLGNAGWLKGLTLRRVLRYSEAAHHQFLPRAAHCWVSNPSDRQHPGLADATLLPNIPYAVELGAKSLELGAWSWELGAHSSQLIAPLFLFVGTLSYSANADGLDAFLKEAWPAIRAQVPLAEFHIVGQGMSARQKARWGWVAGVKAIGFVESLNAAYAGCLATVAPILAGGGTNIKVLESAAYGRVCVLTRVAHRGFEETLPTDVACLRVESIKAMAGACLRLVAQPEWAQALGREGRRCVELHYTRAKFNEAVKAGCERVLG